MGTGHGSGGLTQQTADQFCIQTSPYRMQHTDLSVHTVCSIQTSPYCMQHTDLSVLYAAYSPEHSSHSTHRYVCFNEGEGLCQVGVVEEFLQRSSVVHSLPA